MHEYILLFSSPLACELSCAFSQQGLKEVLDAAKAPPKETKDEP